MDRGFMYFVPGVRAREAADKLLIECGASHAIRPGTQYYGDAGPDGTQGLMLSMVPSMPYDARRQTWMRAISGEYYVGLVNDDRPRASDLARPRMLPGHRVTMADGDEWQIPVARRCTCDAGGQVRYQDALPQAMKLNADGKWEASGTVPEYAALWDAATHCAEVFRNELDPNKKGDVTVTFEEEGRMVTAVLGVNYFVSAEEISMLGLITTESITDVMCSLIDIQGLGELVKKKADAVSGAASG